MTVAGSSPDVVNFFPFIQSFQLHYGHGVNSASNRKENKEFMPAHKADNLTAICEPIVYRMWESRHFTTLWAFTACYRSSFTNKVVLIVQESSCVVELITVFEISCPMQPSVEILPVNKHRSMAY
jgi:hypothetical protein